MFPKLVHETEILLIQKPNIIEEQIPSEYDISSTHKR